ncbi:MAG: SEC-C metal-binding domain-containing protein [Planctomycetota bacterium]|nr:SEC-C metal-binding domain-containing protein [Planctomycetota bacterium]
MPEKPDFLRVVKYNAAASLHMIGHHRPAYKLANELVQEYYDHLGIDPLRDVFRKQPEEVFKRLKTTDTLYDDLKHLADSLDLYARCANALGEKSGLARIHAMKFYSMAGAYDSALKAGQDVVDELIGLRDYKGARDIIEGSLLPSVHRAKIADRVIPIRSQYAVVLAYCGEFTKADTEIKLLSPYEPGLTNAGRAELQNQRALIAKIKTLGPPPAESTMPLARQASKVGRNDPCPCGSGQKYKKCCGVGLS